MGQLCKSVVPSGNIPRAEVRDDTPSTRGSEDEDNDIGAGSVFATHVLLKVRPNHGAFRVSIPWDLEFPIQNCSLYKHCQSWLTNICMHAYMYRKKNRPGKVGYEEIGSDGANAKCYFEVSYGPCSERRNKSCAIVSSVT